MGRPTFIFILAICLLSQTAAAQSKILDSLNLAFQKAKNDTTKCNLLVTITEFLYESKPDTVVYLSNKTIELVDKSLTKANNAEKKTLLMAKASALNNIGIINSEEGNMQTAIEYYLKSLDVHVENQYKIGMTTALNNLGFVYDNNGDIPRALEYYHKALKIQEEINDKEGMALTLNNLAFIYVNQNEILKALEYNTKSLKFRREIGDKIGESQSLNNIGNIYEKHSNVLCANKDSGCAKKNQVLALEFYNKSLAIQTELQDKKGMAYSLNNIAILYKDHGNPNFNGSQEEKLRDGEKIAMEYFNQSLKLQEEINNNLGIAYICNNISNLLIKQGDLKRAFVFSTRSMKIAQEIGYPEIIYRNASTLKNIYKIQNNFTEAFKMLELEVLMRDSLKSQNNRKAAIQKEFQYMYEKKAAEDSVKVAEEKKVVTAQLKQEKTQRFALYGGLALVLIFSVFMVNRFMVTNKQKKIIEIKEHETQQQNVIISQQKHLVEEKQKEILDSINYAKRIQYTLLAHADFLKEHLPDHFVYFNPKDIVSGDFYWATSISKKQEAAGSSVPRSENFKLFYLAVCDSTGHGVPGAFMSLLNIGFLSEAINEKNILEPHEILNYARERLTNSISREGQKDGFDGILMRFEIENNKINSIKYAAANNAPIIISENNMLELPKDRMPVGKGEKAESFTLFNVNFNPGDTIYLYTDGFADQFGGDKGKKFKYKQLNELLTDINQKNTQEQSSVLQTTFQRWKGDLEQVDDVLVIGIKLS